MADKHHSGRNAKSEQRRLEKEERMVLGMNIERNGDVKQAAIIINRDSKRIYEKSIETDGRIKNQISALDKDSPVKDEYNRMLNTNDSFRKKVNSFKKDDK